MKKKYKKDSDLRHTKALRAMLKVRLMYDGESITNIAKTMGVNRTTLSCFLHGHAVNVNYESGRRLFLYLKEANK